MKRKLEASTRDTQNEPNNNEEDTKLIHNFDTHSINLHNVKIKRLKLDHNRGKSNQSPSVESKNRIGDEIDDDMSNNDYDTRDKQERSRVLKEVWNEVAVSLRKLEVYIQDRKVSKKPWDYDEYIKMFTKIYDLCTLPDCIYFEKQLYKHYSRYLKDYLSKRVLPLLKDKHNEDMLQEIVLIWKNFRDIFVKFCSRLFSYLDRFYVITARKNTLRNEGHRLFKETVFDKLKEQLRQIVLLKIREDREQAGSSTVDRSLLRDTLLIFLDMGITEEDQYNSARGNEVYTEEFEIYAEKETTEFYHKRSELWLAESSFTEYMVKAEVKIRDEHLRLSSIFINSSQQKLTKIMDKELLAKNQKRLLEMSGSGVDILIQDEKLEDLSRLFRLMSRIERGLEPIAQIFQDYISRIGRDIYKKHNDEARYKSDYAAFSKFLLGSYVDELIQFHIKMDQLVTGPFQNSAVFHKALSEGFKSFVNLGFRKPNGDTKSLDNTSPENNRTSPEIKTAQLFAFYCDEVLRKRKTESPDDALEKVVHFVQFFSDKDIFIEEYRKQLAKRLLVSGYQDIEERNMISRLKWYYRGVGDLYKLEKMLLDKTLAADMKQEFNNFLEKQQRQLPFEMTVTVLTMGTWPINLRDTLRIHPILADSQKMFKEFYENKYSSTRNLKWAYGRSTVQLDAYFASSCKKKLLDVSTYQACILLHFNDTKELTVKQLMDLTALDLDVIKRTLASLSTAKYDIVLVKREELSTENITEDDMMTEQVMEESKEPSKKKANARKNMNLVANCLSEISESTMIEVNDEFKHKLVRIKIPTPRITEEEVKKTIVNVNSDRIWVLDATIVRIMKTRKTMQLQQLIKEIITQLMDRFHPDLKQIKKRIESLIEREYLKRSDNLSIEYVA